MKKCKTCKILKFLETYRSMTEGERTEVCLNIPDEKGIERPYSWNVA